MRCPAVALALVRSHFQLHAGIARQAAGEREKQPMGGAKAVLVLTRHAPLQMQTKRLLGAVALALCVASAYGGFFVSCPDDDFPRQ